MLGYRFVCLWLFGVTLLVNPSVINRVYYPFPGGETPHFLPVRGHGEVRGRKS
jgi:hypothetical protein